MSSIPVQLEKHLHRKLVRSVRARPGSRNGAGNRAETVVVGLDAVVFLESREASIGITQVGMIEDVEGLKPQLYLDSFLDRYIPKD